MRNFIPSYFLRVYNINLASTDSFILIVHGEMFFLFAEKIKNIVTGMHDANATEQLGCIPIAKDINE